MDQFDSNKLNRTLNLRDVVLLNISCIVGLSSLTQAAQFGYASITLYLIAMVTFLIPSGLMVIELNARLPGEGGFYLWTKKAFGELHGYLAAWCYWLSNIVWLPTVLLLFTTALLYIPGEEYILYADNTTYNLTATLIILWAIVLLNFLGMERAKWIHNIGGVAIWLCMILLLVSGIYYYMTYGSAHVFESRTIFPSISDFSVLPFFAAVAFSFGGLELSSVMGGEVSDARNTLIKAVFYSALAVFLIYIVATLMLIIIIPEHNIGVVDGVVYAFSTVGKDPAMSWVGTAGAVLVALSILGPFGAWFAGTSRLPFVVGLDQYLPAEFGKVHKKWKSPYVSIIVQGVILSIMLIASFSGSTLQEAFLILYDMAVILYFIPFLYMFGAWIWHHKKGTGTGMVVYFHNRKNIVNGIASIGILVTLFAIIISCVPSREIVDKNLFLLKVIGGAILLIGCGFIFYKKRN